MKRLLVHLTLLGCVRPPAPPAEQLVIGTTPGWDDRHVTLRRFERRPGNPWHPVGEPWPAVAGSAGLAWGRGLHPPHVSGHGAGPDKREGDLRAPAGRFALTFATGYDDAPPSGTRLRYQPVGGAWICVDDPRSRRYNEILDSAGAAADWASAELMRRPDELYRWVVVVDHNPAPAVAGGGSCIFLHVWSGPDSATVGCTAMARERLEALIAWLDPAGHPTFVLLPDDVYRSVASAWDLPPASW